MYTKQYVMYSEITIIQLIVNIAKVYYNGVLI